MVTISRHGDYLRSSLERWTKQIWMAQRWNHMVVIPGKVGCRKWNSGAEDAAEGICLIKKIRIELQGGEERNR